jgi:tetratricopeptide (TPR) repeat protein
VKGQRDSHMARLHKKLQVDQTSRVFARLADAFRRSDHLDEAIELCHRGLVQHPEYVSGHIVLGQCYLDLGRLVEARDAFLRAVVLDENNVLVLRLLGNIFFQQGELSQAAGYYRRAIHLDPRNLDLRELLHEVQAKQGEEDPSEEQDQEQSDEDLFTDEDGDSIPSMPAAIPSMMDVPVFGKEVLKPIDPEDHRRWLREMTRETETRDSRLETRDPRPETRLSPEETELLRDEEDEHSPKGPPRGMATATLAEIYFQQGLLDKAIEIYTRVVRHDPGDERSRARLIELRAMRPPESLNEPESWNKPEQMEGTEEDNLETRDNE